MRTPQSVLVARSRTMRAQPTLGEQLLWEALKGSQLGVGFRRQAVIGRFIVDFVAPSAKLVVEVDGGYHAGAAAQRADARKDRALGRLGYRIVRVPDALVREPLADAVAIVVTALTER